MLKPKTLQQRLIVFVLLPLGVVLLVMFWVSFYYARETLLEQFRTASVLRLQRAAHQIDMRLNGPGELLTLFEQTGEQTNGVAVQKAIVERIRQNRGVARVNVTWTGGIAETDRKGAIIGGQMRSDRMPGVRGRFHKARDMKMTPPSIDPQIYDRTVALTSDFEDEAGRVVGRIEIFVNFSYLMTEVMDSGWWQSNKAFLVDGSGVILASAGEATGWKTLGDTGDPFELETLEALGRSACGTLTSGGHPPREVSGFCRLAGAPWYLVFFAPGKDILAPIIQFRNYYYLIAGCFVFVVIVMLKGTTASTVTAIQNVSRAAEKIAAGNYGSPLTATTDDEVGELVRQFNKMAFQLEERERLKADIDLAKEVQQRLLPSSKPMWEGLDVAGKLLYCDETGGDYFDYLDIRKSDMGIVIGDVSGHGIPAALLMASLRSLLRQRLALPGSLGEVVTDVNHLLSQDIGDSGNFVTLFYLNIDRLGGRLQWVRAGHDPAIVYDPVANDCSEMAEGDPALGIEAAWEYKQYERPGLKKGTVLVMGTDGIWETRNSDGKLFGKDRLIEIVRQHHEESAGEIVARIIGAVSKFRGDARPEDDVTLVVVRVTEEFEADVNPRNTGKS